jgi:hypothetical protein
MRADAPPTALVLQQQSRRGSAHVHDVASADRVHAVIGGHQQPSDAVHVGGAASQHLPAWHLDPDIPPYRRAALQIGRAEPAGLIVAWTRTARPSQVPVF